jgi:antitoxin ParD1/3/4
MPTRNVNLTSHYDRFVAKQIRDGRFRNASEVMRAGLHLLEQQAREDAERLALLRSLAAEGFDQLDQGRGIEINNRDQLANYVADLGRRAARRAKTPRNGA